MNDEPLDDLPTVDRSTQPWNWLRSPQALVALACFALGTLFLLGGLLPRLSLSQPVTSAGEPLGALEDSLTLEGGPPDDEAPTELIVYVSGAVFAPDVYRLPAGTRVKDAIVAAGGFRADAAAETLNLAETLGDAQHIHVPPQSPSGSVAAGSSGDGRLDLNRASAADLEELPGVGTVIAERIVARRAEQGPFASVEALREVTGVGSRLYEQIAPLLKVGP